MASAAQVQANRLNARKSTGPRTAAGKEKASRKAVKHGLLAREAVIAGEEPEEFELYREEMLAELAPAGPVEAMLAERVVGLSWRLRRAERLQNAAFAALDGGEPTPLLDARHEEWKQLKGNEWDRGVAGVIDENVALGQVVVADFAEARVLDRLLMYERRIESSLYRTMAQLRNERETRRTREAATPQEGSRSQGGLPASQGSATPAKLASFGANPVPEGASSVDGVASVECGVSDRGAAFETSNEPATPQRSAADSQGPVVPRELCTWIRIMGRMPMLRKRLTASLRTRRRNRCAKRTQFADRGTGLPAPPPELASFMRPMALACSFSHQATKPQRWRIVFQEHSALCSSCLRVSQASSRVAARGGLPAGRPELASFVRRGCIRGENG